MFKSIIQWIPKLVGKAPNGIMALVGIAGIGASQGAANLDLSVLGSQVEGIILAFTGLVTAISALLLAIGVGGATQKLADKE